jgi:adenylate cyclase
VALLGLLASLLSSKLLFFRRLVHGTSVAFPSELGSRSSSVALRQVALAWLKRARRDARGLLKRASEKKLHSFRVSLRRLRALGAHHPTLFSKKELVTLKRIHRATSLGRDRAVQRQWIRRLADENQIEPETALKLLPKKKSKGVVRALRSFAKWDGSVKQRLATVATPKMNLDTTLATDSGVAIAHILPSARKTLARLADGPSDKELHKARLRIKALRYLMEPIARGAYELAPLVDECTALQGWLGDAHDLRLLADLLDEREEGEAACETLAALTRAAEVQANLQLAKALELGLRHGAGDTTPFGSFLDGFDRAAERLRGFGQDHLEIERKYLLTALPKGVAGHTCLELDQGYLPGRDIRERVRRIVGPEGVTYRRTIKAGRGVSRIEFEEPMTAAVFEQLWPLTEGSRVSKRRYVVPDGDLVWEIDEFTDRELVLAEVELPSADIIPTPPDWLSPYVVRDVSEESGFVNQKLAR